ncbi:MAG: exo-alpha-sialidase [Armatimonadetes bacterium]|nr:exo-alpha-sialidase [Candidatus Hippobium faecium]
MNNIFDMSVQVNDGLTQTNASAVETAFDTKYGIIFCAYLTGFGNYGEQRGVVGLSYFPATQPTNSRTITVAEEEGLYEPNILGLGNGCVRIFYVKSSGDKIYYYKDFNFITRELTEEKQVCVKINNDTFPIHPDWYKNYLLKKGYNDFETAEYKGHGLILTSNLKRYDNTVYGTLTSYDYYPIIFRSDDNMATITPICIYPIICDFELDICLKDNIIHSVARCHDGTIKYNTSDDMGKTWSDPVILENGCMCRPQIMTFRDQILIGYNIKDENTGHRPRYSDRTHIKLLLGNSPDPNKNECILDYHSIYGVVYFRLVDILGDLYMAYSDSRIGLETLNTDDREEDGKEAIRWVKL